jgi:FkbH-like protein
MSAQPANGLNVRREEVAGLLAEGHSAAARSALIRLWHEHGGPAAAGFVLSTLERLARPPLACRVAVMRSFTVEPLVPVLRAAAALNGIDIQTYIGPFNAYVQEAVDAASGLYAFKPDVVFLTLQARDLAPDLWSGFADLDSAGTQAAVVRVVDGFRSWLRAFRAHSRASVVVHNLEWPADLANGIGDGQTEPGQMAAFLEINRALAQLPREFGGVYVLDYARLIARHGHTHWFDEQKWQTARMPIAAGALIHLAREWLRYIHPLVGRVSKVLVTDLDNTLWGGVLGEDGLNGIQGGAEYPGTPFHAVQRALLDFHRRGILLAICSKNNQADALEALTKHPGMLLHSEHFAAMRINWQDKATNLRKIAAELNVGTDSLAFLDDNPAEREYVRENLPDVAVIEMGAGPESLAEALRAAPWFERPSRTTADRARSRMYAERRQRELAQQQAPSLEEFYRSLEQTAQVAPADAESLARFAQLTQKTNQFNLTIRRYSEQQLADMLRDSVWDALTLRAKDRFGDHGIVGAALMRQSGPVCEIDTFLLSCRVIGRELEKVLLARLAELAVKRGATLLCGRFLPTAKNAPAKDFYEKIGFRREEDDGPGTFWSLDLHLNQPGYPSWIRVEVLEGATRD